jgi:transcription initiation factor TFIIB
VILGGRLHDEWLSADEVTTYCRFDDGELQSTVTLLSSELPLHLPPVDPQMCLDALVERLEIDTSIEATVRGALDRGIEAGLANGRNPEGVAAGAIWYVAVEDELSRAELLDACSVAEKTARDRFNEFRELESEGDSSE